MVNNYLNDLYIHNIFYLYYININKALLKRFTIHRQLCQYLKHNRRK